MHVATVAATVAKKPFQEAWLSPTSCMMLVHALLDLSMIVVSHSYQCLSVVMRISEDTGG